MEKMINVLLIGGGGREHALAWKIAKSNLLNKFYSINGSDAISEFAELINIQWNNFEEVVKFCKEKLIDLVVIGPEKPVYEGLSDYLNANNINVFAPSKEAAQIESSKHFTKEICKESNIPTADFQTFTDINKIKEYFEICNYPIVVKYDGLADGKGVIIANNKSEALDAIDKLYSLYKDTFKVVIEEFLIGRELSFFAISDGFSVKPLMCAQDYKRAYDGDKGENTGGMGVISGDFLTNKDLEHKIMSKIITPLLENLKSKNIIYKGIIFAGLMIDKDENPFVIEFNARFGDPETQTICMRMESDLLELLYKATIGKLDEVEIKISNKNALCVVVASKGYPNKYEKNIKIGALADKRIFHHGTKFIDGEYYSNGGRVFSINVIGDDIKLMRKESYDLINQIDWSGGFCRSDIGLEYEDIML